LGEAIDGKGPIFADREVPLHAEPPDPVRRPRVTEVLKVGVRAMDGLLTCGRGQRLGIFAGSGVGKSTVMGMLARNAEADVNVISLVGERGREVRDFIEESLGEAGLKKSVVVVATSDQPPLIRLKAAFVATAIAEYFRDLGKKVILMMDSVTRFAMAQREIGLAAGEPPTTRGYTPSVFALLPKLMERSGTSEAGSITAFYTILVEGDDFNEPIADQSRSILDGHIILSRELAARNHYPAIDVPHSVSRLMTGLVSDEHKAASAKLREVLARYSEAEDLINIGAYVKGSNPKIDYALSKIEVVNEFLKQGTFEKIDYKDTVRRLISIFA
jgi:flagellum-specific ATP synthase